MNTLRVKASNGIAAQRAGSVIQSPLFYMKAAELAAAASPPSAEVRGGLGRYKLSRSSIFIHGLFLVVSFEKATRIAHLYNLREE